MDCRREHRYRGTRDVVSRDSGVPTLSDRRDQTRMTAVLEAHDLHKSYVGGDGGAINVLMGVDITLARREMVAVVGASGAGKSTMLHVLGALDKPTRGYVVIGGEPVNGLDEEQLAALRNRSVGFVFQFHHLLREFTALENVAMPLRIGGRDGKVARDK